MISQSDACAKSKIRWSLHHQPNQPSPASINNACCVHVSMFRAGNCLIQGSMQSCAHELYTKWFTALERNYRSQRKKQKRYNHHTNTTPSWYEYPNTISHHHKPLYCHYNIFVQPSYNPQPLWTNHTINIPSSSSPHTMIPPSSLTHLTYNSHTHIMKWSFAIIMESSYLIIEAKYNHDMSIIDSAFDHHMSHHAMIDNKNMPKVIATSTGTHHNTSTKSSLNLLEFLHSKFPKARKLKAA